MSNTASLGFVFPGQGSQRIGMLADAAVEHPSVGQTYSEAADALGYDLWELIQTGEAESLNMTEVTQPALLASSVALWRSWRAAGGAAPSLLAGHSLGEFSALVCAGAIGFADGLRLVRARGKAMQEAVPAGEGAMAAVIGLDDAEVDTVCQGVASTTGSVVAAVNYNSPGQVVIAGHADAVDDAGALLKQSGAKRVLPLPVSAPFHTSLMRPAGETLEAALADITVSAPDIPVVHNVHASTETEPSRIRALLVEQTYSPVRWTDCIKTMSGKGISAFVECGPGKVLSGLLRRIDKTAASFAIETAGDLSSTLSALSQEQYV
ncbi:MAG: ACP S-malonyltransferase [Pseudomonadota bacterium]